MSDNEKLPSLREYARLDAAWQQLVRERDEAVHELRAVRGGKEMTFGQAIYQAEQGRRIYRKGWNGKNMFVAYMPAYTIAEQHVNGRTKHFVPTGDLHVKAYFAMLAADGGWQPGWVPSQADMLSKDWEVIPEATP